MTKRSIQYFIYKKQFRNKWKHLAALSNQFKKGDLFHRKEDIRQILSELIGVDLPMFSDICVAPNEEPVSFTHEIKVNESWPADLINKNLGYKIKKP